MPEIDVHKEIKERLKGGEPDICGIDATPNDEYPIRILKAYLHRTEARWLLTGCTDRLHQIYDAMNEAQEKRAEILREAIAKLREAEPVNPSDYKPEDWLPTPEERERLLEDE